MAKIDGISRRSLFGSSLALGGALAMDGWPSLAEAADFAVPTGLVDGPWVDATIPQLQQMMRQRKLTSVQLTRNYLARIWQLNPLLHAVIQINPAALIIAARRDRERARKHVRGPLHGIPVLIKDNIATGDWMQTTAGSLALVGSRPPGDAPLVAQLRQAGAVILGKANLSEWANFRGFGSYNGWSARGGFTRNPYLLDLDTLGSSSGSAVSVGANLCSVAVGTETDGSILAPSNHNHTFGLKPTVGLVSGQRIIPIAHSQDTAGPMTRNVTDAAILLGALADGFGDYSGALERGGLAGKRIGVDWKYFEDPFWGNPDAQPIMTDVLATMEGLGATLVDVETDPSFLLEFDEFNVLLFEFKVQIAEYLATLGATSLATLADLIQFNSDHCLEEMKYFGQELFEMAEATSGDLTDPSYLASRAFCIQKSRVEGIDGALNSVDPPLDALVAPTWSGLYSIAAVAGYPSLSLPVGLLDDGRPVGFCMVGTAYQEEKLLAMAYDLEQERPPRVPPPFAGSVPPEPPDAGICTAGGSASRHAAGEAAWRGRRVI